MVTLECILKLVCKGHGISEEEIRSEDRRREYSESRQMYCYLANKHTRCTLRAIGELINRDHSTVYAAKKRLEDNLRYTETAEMLNKIEYEIKLESIVRSAH